MNVKTSRKSKPAGEEKFGTPQWWLNAIQKGEKARKKYGKEDRWEDLEDYYMHNGFEQDEPCFNLVYAQGRAMLPMLITRNPYIMVEPRRPDFAPTASIFEGLDNWLVQEMEVKKTLKKMILNAFLTNVGIHQIGWDFGESQSKHIDFLADRARRTNFPWSSVVHPSKIVFAPGTTEIRTCRWYAKMIIRPTRILSKTFGDKVVGTHIPSDFKYSRTLAKIYNADNMEEEYTVLWEVHEAEERTWFLLSTDGRFIFGPREDPLQVDGLPLDLIEFNENTRSIWGTPDAIYIEPIMHEGNDCRYQVMKQRRLASLKFLIDENLISESEIEKLFEEDIPVGIRVKNLGDKKVSDCLALVQPHIMAEIQTYEKDLLYDAQLLLGTGPNQFGTFAPGRRTKYEAQIVESRNQVRVNERQEQIIDALSGIFRKVNQLIRKYWTKEIPIKVVGIDAALYWVNVNPSELKDEVDLNISAESMIPPSADKTKAEMMETLQLLSKVPNANIIPLVQQLLRRFPWADTSKYLPQAVQEQAMTPEQFGNNQRRLSTSDNLGTTAQNNLSGLKNAMLSLPMSGMQNQG